MSQNKNGSFKEDLNYIHDLLTKLDSRMDDMHTVQIRHEENLKVHMKRSDAIEREFKPVKSFVDMAKGVGAFILLLSLIATTVMVFK